MEDRNFQARKEEHGGFHDWIWHTSHEGRYRWVTCNFLTKEEYTTRHHRDNIRISANSHVSQIRYSLVVILGLNSVSGVQYKEMMTDRWWKVLTGIIDIVKSEV